jgi:hypothetical protein
MDKLQPTIARLSFLALLLFAPACASAQATGCSLVVRVFDPSGKAFPTNVEVREQDGRSIEKPAKSGVAEFCDLGVAPVAIDVGPACDRVSVNNVQLKWGKTVDIKVVYDAGICEQRHRDVPFAGPSCDLLFRVRGPSGQAIPNPLVEVGDSFERKVLSDDFGRAYLRVTWDTPLHARISAAGYNSVILSEQCPRLKGAHDRVIVLSPKATGRP